MLYAIILSTLFVGSFLIGWYFLAPETQVMKQPTPENSQTRNDWGWTDDYCTWDVRIRQNGTISNIKIPVCKF